MTLGGTIYPHFRGGLGQLNAMRDMADAGEELRLVDGRGYVLGTYVITRISENQAIFASEGVPLKQEFQIGWLYTAKTVCPIAPAVAAARAATSRAAATVAAAATAGWRWRTTLRALLMTTYISQQNDELDAICFKFYGYTNGSVEAVSRRTATWPVSCHCCVRDCDRDARDHSASFDHSAEDLGLSHAAIVPHQLERKRHHPGGR